MERVNRQYRAGDGEGGGDGQGDGKAANAEDGKQAGAAGAGSKQGSSTHAPIGTSQLRGEDDAPGGFLMDDEEEQRPVEHAQQPDTERARPRVLPARLSRDRRANEPSLSFHEQGSTPDAENGSYGEYMDADADGSADAHDGNPREGQGGQEEDAGTGTGAGTLEDFWTSTSASASASASAHEGGAQSQPTAAARIRSLHELAAAEEEMSTTPTLTQEDVPEASTMPRPDIASRDLAQKKEASGNTKRGIRTLMRKRPAGATGADGDDGEDWDGEEESLNTTLSKRPRRSASARASPAKPARASASASRRGGRAAARKSNGNGAVAVTRT